MSGNSAFQVGIRGLATGITATVINLIYNFIFRGITKLSLPVSVINVSTIIFATMILYVITIIAAISGMNFHMSNDVKITRQFDGFYTGMVIITGLCAAFFIPWLARHKNAFFD